jgi:hypothetical protein
MIGAALGEGLARVAHSPGETQALWALLGMGAMLSGSLGVPLTAILFSIELTHAMAALLPLVLACTASYLVTSLLMPRSILTEKLSRRGYHLSREYGVDPLETMSVAEVMAELPASGEYEVSNDLVRTMPDVFTYADEPCRAAAEQMAMTGIMSIPVLDRETGRVRGIVSVHELLAGRKRAVVRESERMRVFRVFAKMSRSFVEDSTE